MPRVKPYKPDPRASDTLARIGGQQAVTRKSYKEICRVGGIPYVSFMRHIRDIGEMRLKELWAFEDACRKLGG